MGSSLLEQLQKSGLVDEKRARKAKTQKYQDKKKTGKNQVAEEAKQLAAKAKADQAERNRKAEEKRKEDNQRRSSAAQIKQMIEDNLIKERDGETVYNFAAGSNGSKIKRLYLSEAVHKQVVSGALSVVNLNGRYELVPASVADKIKERDEKVIVVDNRNNEADKPAEDDPYAGYEVPDDLIW